MAQLSYKDLPSTASDDEIQMLDVTGDEDDDASEVTELPDGSALVKNPEKPEKPQENGFYANLAETLESRDLSRWGIDLCERVESDKKSRQQRDKQQAEGIRRTGMGGDAPGGAEFDGASKVVHPMLAKGCVDFASKAIKELYPSSGPCKTQLVGKSTDAKLSKAERKKTYLNWQLTTQVQENRAEFERLLSQLPLGGSQYKRWWWDEGMRRNRTETVFIDDVFLPYNQNDFYTSHRVTHRQYVSKLEFERRTTSGLYREINSSAPPVGLNDKSESREASERAEGVEEDTSAYNDAGLREIYQIYADIDIEEEGETAPYIIHVEEYSHQVLGVYRNWKESDETQAKKHWMVEYTFIPWRGPHGMGLNHLIGSMAAAATGALRGLLDSAHIQNFPGGLKLKGGRTAGQSITVNATELAEIDVPVGVDDIRKAVMPFPFNGPSAVLQTLLEFLTQQAETLVATANERIADGGANMPMGTALALIEQGSINFSAIHSRAHASLKKELEIVHRLNSEHLSDKETVEDLGELVVSRADFEGPIDVIPVSDPNIFSEAQRYAQFQAVLQLSTNPAFAQFFNPAKLLRRAVKLLQVTDPEEIAQLPKEPERLSALEENFASAAPEPTPLKVYEEQDDLAHLETHVHFMSSPVFGANPIIAPQSLPALIAHCKDHLMAFYRKHTMAASEAMAQAAKMQGAQIDEAQAQAKGSAFADEQMVKSLGPMVMPALEAAQKLLKSLVPPPQADPNIQLAESTKTQLAQSDAQLQQALKKMDLDYNANRDQLDRQANEQAAIMATQTSQADYQSEERVAQIKHEAGEHMVKLEAQIEVSHNLIKDQMDQRSQQAQDEFMVTMQLIKAQNAEQLAVLKSLLAAGTAPQTNADGSTTSADVPDITSLIQPLIDSMVQANSIMTQQLGGNTTLNTVIETMKKLAAPRVSQFITDESGRKTGMRSVIEEQNNG